MMTLARLEPVASEEKSKKSVETTVALTAPDLSVVADKIRIHLL